MTVRPLRLSPLAIPFLVALAAHASACMEPLVDDGVDRSSEVFAPGTTLPDLQADPAVWELMRAAIPEERTGLIARRQAFYADQLVDWWDLGPASETPVAGYLLVRPDPAGPYLADGTRFASIGAPPILTVIPGDLGYSPLVRLVLVPVTARYQGEVIASIEAIAAAQALGLATASLRIPLAWNAPVVLADARLDRRPDAPAERPQTAYYREQVVHFFDFGTVFVPGATAPIANQYTLRREGGEPISEVVRGIDITGDGDASDTNDLFAAGPDDPGFSPMVHAVEVIVAPDLQGIDSYRDGGASDLTAARDLFGAGPGMDPSVVRAVYPDLVVYDRPFVVREAAPE